MDSEPFYGLRNSRSWCAWLFIFFVYIKKLLRQLWLLFFYLKSFTIFVVLLSLKSGYYEGSLGYPKNTQIFITIDFSGNLAWFEVFPFVWKVYYWGNIIVTKSGYFEGIPWPSKKYPNLYDIIDFSVNFSGFGIFSFCLKGSIIV